MRKGEPFNYRTLFAKNVPDTYTHNLPRRAKYDFAVAYPDPDSVPIHALVDALKEALDLEGRELAVYPHPEGYPQLREFVAAKLGRDRGMKVSEEDIILADGSSQPIHILVEALIDPGDVVITEDYVYSGTLRTLRRFRADVRGVCCDQDGMLPDFLEETFQVAIAEGNKPKLVYTIPTFQNPQGWTMTLERRQELLRLSGKYGVPIIEDDCYVDLRYEGDPVASIHSLDEEGLVMYVGSFSKIIAPGMRLGYLTAPPAVMSRAKAIKSGGGVNQFAALAVHRYATNLMDNDIAKRNEILMAKRDAMLSAIGENFGSSATWSHPDGALYIWLKMPEMADFVSIQDKALEAEVGYHPGPVFAPDGISGKNYVRLCFGYNTTEEIQEGITRLAKVLDLAGMLGA